MKTKHLLFAAALPLAFAACQNEEFESANSPELSNDQRPLVEVKLDFQKGDANTRVSYDGENYGWQATDKIGAFLMDEIKSSNRPFGATAADWAKETWLEHYKLVNYIHTDYPFSWNGTNKAWEAPSKLQEGNYFFAAPYETYEGQRQLIHELDNQIQTGGTEANMNAAIAKNQYFIGYAQVKAGSGNKEALKSVVMTPTLAPIKVTLKNIGSLAKDVEKIIVYGDQVATALTVNPIDAAYGGTDADNGSIKGGQAYNLNSAGGEGNSNEFNYANLIDATEDLAVSSDATSFVYNIASGAEDYKKGDALRQIVKPSYSTATASQAPEIEKQAILSFESPVKVESKGEIHFAVMVNTIPTVTANKLFMDIITTQGQITKIDLTVKKEAETTQPGAGLDPNTVLTNIAIKSLKPSVKNELIIQFDNNSVVKAQAISVDDEAKLMAFINWNAENQRVNTATLLKDVHFTKAMYDALKATGYKGSLAIKAQDEAKLVVDNDVPTDVLNLLEKTTDANIVLDGERELTKAIAEKLNTDGSTKLTIENQGTMIVKEEVVAYAKLMNYGTIKVAETGKLQGQASGDKIYNYGIIENKGEISNVNNAVEDDFKGLIKTSGKRNHIQKNEADATIQLTNIGDPVQMVSSNAGTIYFETAAGVKASELKEVKGKRSVGVTKLNVTGGTIDFDNTNNATVEELLINGTVSVEGWNGATPRVSTYHAFTAVKKAEISGNVTFDNAGIEGLSKVLVNKDASLTFERAAKFNEVTFVKGATVRVNESGKVEVDKVTWNNNNISNFGEFLWIVENNGTVNVIEGKDIAQKSTTTETKTYKLNVIVDDSGSATTDAPTSDGNFTVANLKALATFMTNKSGGQLAWPENTTYEIADITISSAIALSAEPKVENYGNNHYSYLKTYAASKEVKLGANLSDLTADMGLSFSKLTVTAAATVSGDNTQPNVTILSVNSLDYTAAKLTVTDGYIKISGEAQIGDGSTSIKGTSSNLDVTAGRVVTTNKDKTGGANALVQWDATTSKWKALN